MGNIITDTIEFFIKLNRRMEHQVVEGRPYMITGGKMEELLEPEWPPIMMNSLSSLASYILTDCDNLVNHRKCFVHIVDHTEVELVSYTFGPFLQRDMIVTCCHKTEYDFNGSGRLEMSQEKAMMILQTWFQKSDDQEYLLSLIGHIVIDDETDVVDDGHKQRVSVRNSITTVNEEEVKRIVELRPINITFGEIEQPMIPYVVRLKQKDNSVRLVLTPIKDPDWRIKTQMRISDYLREKGVECPIFY